MKDRKPWCKYKPVLIEGSYYIGTKLCYQPGNRYDSELACYHACLKQEACELSARLDHLVDYLRDEGATDQSDPRGFLI